MTAWHPQLVVVAPGCAHVYLVPDNGSLSRIHTVEWEAPDPLTEKVGRTMHALSQLFRQVDVPEPDNVHALAASLWASLDRRQRPTPPV